MQKQATYEELLAQNSALKKQVKVLGEKNDRLTKKNETITIQNKK